MDVTQSLDSLRQEVEGCDLVAFADLSSGMVLCHSAATPPPQEELDALCGAATELLTGDVAKGAGAAAGASDEDHATKALVATGEEVRLYIRAEAEKPEALICVCSPEGDLVRILDCARSTLDSIVASG